MREGFKLWAVGFLKTFAFDKFNFGENGKNAHSYSMM